jgi:hypothetical protein
MKTKRSTECAVLMGLGARHGCASGSKLAFHVDFRPQIYRVRIFCGGQRSCRRDLLDHMIVLNERHLKRLISSYVLYYHQDRTHLGLAKDTPAGRPTEIGSARERKIQSFPRLGGLHHRYAVAA